MGGAEGEEAAPFLDPGRDAGMVLEWLRSELQLVGSDDKVALAAAELLGVDPARFPERTSLLVECHAVIFEGGGGGGGRSRGSSIRSSGTRSRASSSSAAAFASSTSDMAPAPAARPIVEKARWYWQEDQSHIDKHNPADVLQPGNWVSYSGSAGRELDEKYGAHVNSGGPAVVKVNRTDRLEPPGTYLLTCACLLTDRHY